MERKRITLPSYSECWIAHRGRATDKYLHYLDFYDAHTKHLWEGPTSLLEIGVQNGGNLQVWETLLGSNSTVVGVDIDARTRIGMREVIIVDAKKASDKLGQLRFDIIVDDGSHLMTDFEPTFLQLWERLNPAGVYVIEDLHYEVQIGASIGSFFADMIDAMHVRYARGSIPSPSYSRFPLAEQIKTIIIEDSIVGIVKHSVGTFQPKRVMSGARDDAAYPVVSSQAQGSFTHVADIEFD